MEGFYIPSIEVAWVYTHANLYHEKSQLGRALWHIAFGVLGFYFGQIYPATDEVRIWFARRIGYGVLGLDLFRVWIYHWLVKDQDPKSGNWAKRKGRWVFLQLEKWLLRKTKILREEEERATISAATPFSLGVMPGLEMGVPIFLIVPAVMTLGFADPAAREFGLRWGRLKFFLCKKKSWQGLGAFVLVGWCAVMSSFSLNVDFPLYPVEHNVRIFVALLVSVLLAGVVEAFTEPLGVWLRSRTRWDRVNDTLARLFDDNLLIPLTFTGTMGVFMAF